MDNPAPLITDEELAADLAALAGGAVGALGTPMAGVNVLLVG